MLCGGTKRQTMIGYSRQYTTKARTLLLWDLADVGILSHGICTRVCRSLLWLLESLWQRVEAFVFRVPRRTCSGWTLLNSGSVAQNCRAWPRVNLLSLEFYDSHLMFQMTPNRICNARILWRSGSGTPQLPLPAAVEVRWTTWERTTKQK